MPATQDLYAHSKPGRPPSEWQPLEVHLRNVADLAGQFADAFGAKEWGEAAGLLHDAGKSAPGFQAYLRASTDVDPHVGEQAGRVDHSTAGAQFAVRRFPLLGHLLAYALAGHHGGLPDAIAGGTCLQDRLAKRLEAAASGCAADAPHELGVPRWLGSALAARDGFAAAFFGRMVYSCLVDADFLDTEWFLDPERAAQRPRWPADLWLRLEKALDRHVGSFGEPRTAVDRQRARVREECLSAASERPGFFSLNVPTGGGKTLASLAFAVRHARMHGLSRVIYVIPLTSIIEQNAEVFRNVTHSVSRECGQVVVEHHSNFDAEQENVRTRLASENWDAPVVVTTSVQFYESLFANRSRRCRKLHNIAQSVIILDEVQALPVDCLAPCLRTLRELVDHYGSTVVLCTATQPAIERRPDFTIGLTGVRPIVGAPDDLYRSLKRVNVNRIGKLADDELAERLEAEHQVLCIVNTRGHATELFRLLGEGGGSHVHLSAAMCPAHRSQVLAEVKARVASKDVCRVVSTQLVEAGVDVSFPVVYRSLAGADAIAQAAGRCNRNGELPRGGRVWVFESEHVVAERYFAETAGYAKEVMELHDDLLSPDAIEHFFRLYYWGRSNRWDARSILDAFHLQNDPRLPFLMAYARAARDFRLIDSGQMPVIVPWDEKARRLCERIRAAEDVGFGILRPLQRYTVQIRRRTWEEHVGRTIELVHGQFPILSSVEMNYSPTLGLSLEDAGGFLSV